MSPLSTFHSSGSSSRLVERKKRPNGVRRTASGSNSPSVPRSLVMLRNFTILKGLPCMPGRTWVKKTGLPSLRRTIQITTNRGKASTSRAQADTTTSNSRFMRLSLRIAEFER